MKSSLREELSSIHAPNLNTDNTDTRKDDQEMKSSWREEFRSRRSSWIAKDDGSDTNNKASSSSLYSTTKLRKVEPSTENKWMKSRDDEQSASSGYESFVSTRYAAAPLKSVEKLKMEKYKKDDN